MIYHTYYTIYILLLLLGARTRAFRGLSPSPLFYTCDKCDKCDKSKRPGIDGISKPLDHYPAIGHGARTTNEGGIEMGMVDWSKPIEAVHESGAIEAASRLRSGPVWPDDCGQYHVGCEAGMFWNEDGSPWGDYGAWRIRNVGIEDDELATLRAFRERALARYPDLAEPESDSDAAYRLTKAYEAQPHGTPYDLARDAIAWARANPR